MYIRVSISKYVNVFVLARWGNTNCIGAGNETAVGTKSALLHAVGQQNKKISDNNLIKKKLIKK